MKKVELLAPAGNYECFVGAVNAGADAVYIGGNKFGARAYADNFTQEEICKAIKYGHLFHKKIYMTVNTLLKERETAELVSYMEPFYDAGLDGVIVQDIGVFHILQKYFPGLQLHASTQMTLTGRYGAQALKNMGAVRIVPARELSLEEIKEIKAHVEIEIETFIHGALCYCYSGQCLFSSMLGERSGNRGRCAGPCRLPYGTQFSSKKALEEYPLSLKDLCTIDFVPELIKAGIDSFKIEGRMKKPEYVAGVTAMYRKYIDLYYDNPCEKIRVSKEDISFLKSLYIRSEIQEGYYHKQNSSDMITMEKPSYSGCSKELLLDIREKYLSKVKKIGVKGHVVIEAGAPMQMFLSAGHKQVVVSGDIPQEAENRPATEELVKKQLEKMGESSFYWKELSVEIKDGCFLPIKSYNEIRRMGLKVLENAILQIDRKESIVITEDKGTAYTQSAMQESSKAPATETSIEASVITKEQLQACLSSKFVSRIIIDADLVLQDKEVHSMIKSYQNLDKIFILQMPYILRKRSYPQLQSYENLAKQQSCFSGIFVSSIDALEWVLENNFGTDLYLGEHIYQMNTSAFEQILELTEKRGVLREVSLPYELNKWEMLDLKHLFPWMSLSIYGRIPLMITANCIKKTYGKCNHKQQETWTYLTDRMHTRIPVRSQCIHCYNILYNSVPLSLHTVFQEMKEWGLQAFRFNFSTETREETAQILSFYEKGEGSIPFSGFTKGHFKKSVE